MTENNDLFRNPNDLDKKPIINKDIDYDQYNNDFYQQQRNRKIDTLLILTYVLISLIAGFIGGLIKTHEYGYLSEAIDNVEVTTPITFTVTDNINEDTTEIDEVYPFAITINGEITNNSEYFIPLLEIPIEFFDEAGKSIGILQVIHKDFEVGETYIIEESTVSSINPDRIETNLRIDAPSRFYSIINLTQSLILFGLFIFIARMSLIIDWKNFKSNKAYNMGLILKGFLFIYIAAFLSQTLLNLLGVTSTSQNEMMIQSLFEKNLFDISVLFILLVVLTPVIEELIFRKVIYNFVESKTNHILAILSSGIIFGLMHVIQYGDFLQSIPYVMMGLVFGYIYHNSRKNIFVVIGVHTVNNFISWLLSVLAVYGLII